MGLLPLRSWDYWWHLCAARWSSWHGGELLERNAFLYTLPEHAPSLSQPWLSQKLLYWLQLGVGLSGSLLCRNALVVGAILTLCVLFRKERISPVVSALSLLAALPMMMATMTLRTHLFAWPLFLGLLVFMRALRRSSDTSSALWLVVAIPVTALWTQLHGSFLLPCVLLGAWMLARFTDVARRWKTSPRPAGILALLGLMAICATLGPSLHPAGLQAVYAYLFDVSSDPVVRQTVTEWLPTTPSRHPTMAPLLYAWLLVGAWFFWQRRRIFDWFDVIVFFGFGALAIAQARGLLWFSLVAPLMLTPHLPGAIEDIVDEEDVPVSLQAIHLTLILVLGVLALAPQPGMKTRAFLFDLATVSPVRREEPLRGLVTQDAPMEAMQWLVDHPPYRRLFHDQRWAGLILWTLMEPGKSSQIVFVDQRIELPGEQVWALHESIGLARSAWRLQLEAHDVTAILVDPHTQAPLFEVLSSDTSWRKVSSSPHDALFVLDPSLGEASAVTRDVDRAPQGGTAHE